MSIELNKESVEQADASSCQGTNCGTTTGDHSSECLAEAAAGQGWELKPGDLCGRDCPIHKISVEQAGGDERAAFEQWLEQHMSHHLSPELDLAKYEDSGEYRYNPAADYWKAWQARAALASTPVADESPMAKMADALREKARQEQQAYQDRRNQATEWGPMPEGTEADRPISTAPVAHIAGDETSRYLEWAKDRSAWEMPVGTPVYYAALAQPSPAQAEEERPEVVAVARIIRNDTPHALMAAIPVFDTKGPFEEGETLMKVAQHERIVGALRAERDGAIKLLRQSVWQKIERLTQQRDAALARVAELERQEPVDVPGPGPDEIHQMAFEEGQPAEDGDGYLFSAEEFDLFVQRLLDSCATPVAWAQHSVPEVFREKFEQCMKLAFAEIAQYVSPENARDPQSRARRATALATELRAMLAAAPAQGGE